MRLIGHFANFHMTGRCYCLGLFLKREESQLSNITSTGCTIHHFSLCLHHFFASIFIDLFIKYSLNARFDLLNNSAMQSTMFPNLPSNDINLNRLETINYCLPHFFLCPSPKVSTLHWSCFSCKFAKSKVQLTHIICIFNSFD
jgi:hypothetical protein